MFRPARSWGTQALAAAGAPGVLANMRHRLDALGLRQPGAQPQPLEALLAMARIGAELAQHLVGWRNDGAQLGAVRSGWLEPKEWLAAIFAVLPAAVALAMHCVLAFVCLGTCCLFSKKQSQPPSTQEVAVS